MLFKTRIVLAIGLVSLLALSIPAFGLPTPSGTAQLPAKAHGAVQKKQISLHAAKSQPNEPAARLASLAVTEPPNRPMFGWPKLVSEARKYLGTNPTDRKRLWCATFMNMVLAKLGYAGTNSDAAKSFAYYGRRISEPKIGAIAVLSRGKRGGHVGVVSGIDSQGNPIIISGNHGHRVGEAVYSRARVIAYVMPTDRRPVTQVADRSPPKRVASEAAFEGPITELLAAIEAEQNRRERPSRSAPQAQPPAPPPQASAHRLPLDPGLAELLGLKDRVQPSPSRPAPQRQQRMQQYEPGRVAAAETALSGVRR